MPQQSRGYLRACRASRCSASWLHDEPARADRSDVAGVEAWNPGRARGQSLARLPAAISGIALPRWISLARRKIPLQAGLAECAVPQPLQKRTGRRLAAITRSLDLDRAGRR